MCILLEWMGNSNLLWTKTICSEIWTCFLDKNNSHSKIKLKQTRKGVIPSHIEACLAACDGSTPLIFHPSMLKRIQLTVVLKKISYGF